MIFWGALAIMVVEGSAAAAESRLGVQEPSARVTVIGADLNDADTARLTSAAREGGSSVAFSHWYETGLVTLFDPEKRIDAARELRSDPPGARAIVTTNFPGAPEQTVRAARAGNDNLTDIVGRFSTTASFEDRTPAAFFTPEALRFGGGTYWIFGTRENTVQPITDALEDGGLRIVDISFTPDTALPALITRGVASPFGIIAVGFGSVVVLAPIFAMVALLTAHGTRYTVWAQAGASRGFLRRDQLRTTLGPALLGGAVGALITAGWVSAAAESLLSAPETIALTLGAALCLHVLSLAIQTGIALRWTSTTVRHVVPH
ncbi:hypothetical protein D9V32_12405 [Mycetocola tolaasinivorans]|uniref:Uncharacterized protein n=1 Tax=Mycetocola tolaasinivorans TaxID=76635 RepID=A0A3L7A2G5_9MICO|nr:hypothetical protein [Mycetocola tolaasinivorans]RLP74486.1 hypothetical protein D9V32_12405 [Mycetocola tolaasinivorans]